MGVNTIAARLVFTTAGAAINARTFVKHLKIAQQNMLGLKEAALKSGTSVQEMLGVMREARAVTHTQRNIKLATTAVSTFTRVVTEARKVYNAFTRDAKSGPSADKLDLLTASVRNFTSRLSTVAVGRAKGQGGGGGFGVIGNVMNELADDAILSGVQEGGRVVAGSGGLLGYWIKLATVMEGANVTFDTMLGSHEKSVELMRQLTEYSAKTPFNRMDVISASKRLLSVTGGDIGKNTDLTKLAGNVAALRPGSTVSDVARGIVGATTGEFEILKSTFGIVLRAKMFEDVGESGGKAYSEAVIKEIKRQFKEKTGGRDLVGALSDTIMGQASTLMDNFDIIGEQIGTKLTQIFDIKGTLSGASEVVGQFASAIQHFMDPSKDPDGALLEGVDRRVIMFAEDLVWGMDKLKEFRDIVIPAVRRKVTELILTVIEWRTQLMTAWIGIKAVGLTLAALLTPLVAVGAVLIGVVGVAFNMVAGALTIGLPALILFGTVITGMIIPAAIIAGTVMLTLASILAAMVTGFVAFKEEGETSWQALVRMMKIAANVAVHVWGIVTGVATGFMSSFGPDVWIAVEDIFMSMKRVGNAVGAIFAPLLKLLSLSGTGVSDGWWYLGAAVGHVLGGLIVLVSKSVRFLSAIFSDMMEIASESVAPFLSDIYRIARAFNDFMKGVGDSRANLKIIMTGVLDIITAPFRHFFGDVIDIFATGMRDVESVVRPWNTFLADKLNSAATVFETASDSLHEGFLSTSNLFKQGLNLTVGGVITAVTPVQVNVDGQKVAEAVTTNEIRARNAGRGGDPVTPEEMGFVIEGSTIRPVLMNEVAKEF